MPTIIKYYTKNVYGQTLEYVLDGTQAATLQRLTGKKTIDSTTRANIVALTEGKVQFERVFEPA